MHTNTLIGLGALLLALGCGLYVVVKILFPSRAANLRSLMSNYNGSDNRSINRPDPNQVELEKIKRAVRTKGRKEVVTLQEKFFQAGLFGPEEKRNFDILRVVFPLILGPVFGVIGSKINNELMIAGLILGGAFGFRIPYMLLDMKLKSRADDILYFLPLVIEQVVIGVSSSLDIGPCLQRVVQMSDERDTHNPVTELIRHAHYYVRSGVSLEDALIEVGKRSGHTELKHTFMSLSQVAKHGGEVTRQLQELADAVANQREAKIETKIKKLELEATMPVSVVFFGFLIIILA